MAQRGGTAPAGAGLDPFLPWTPQGCAAVIPPVISARVPARNPGNPQPHSRRAPLPHDAKGRLVMPSYRS
jgi:hypothetical protein